MSDNKIITDHYDVWSPWYDFGDIFEYWNEIK